MVDRMMISMLEFIVYISASYIAIALAKVTGIL